MNKQCIEKKTSPNKLNDVLKIMRITVLLLFFFSLFSSVAKSNAQKFTFNLKQSTIKAICKKIEQESDFIFVFSDNSEKMIGKKVDINANSKNVKEILNTALSDTGLGYKILDKQIVIYETKKAPTAIVNQQGKQRNVVGVIVDGQTKETIIGANIRIEGSDKGTVTDTDGNFSIEVSGNSAVLVISYIGYEDLKISVGNRSNLGTLEMALGAEALEEVVITAFGAGQKKASIVGAVQTIRPSELRVPSANLSTSFAGRMAGVIAFQRSGQPGADGAEFYIRGISTLSGQRSPLIILDGVEVSASDLNALDTDVIDGFSILKDATATALYGSRGANGVMIITTKSGRNLDKPAIGFRIENNVSQPSYLPKFADGSTFMRLYNEAVRNLSSGAIPYNQEQIEGVQKGLNPYVFPNINWYDEMFKGQTFNQKLNFNIRGGGKKLDYFMNVTVNHETGLLRGRSKEFFTFDNNINIMRYAFNNNINANLSESAKISLKLNAQLMDKRGPNFDDINTIFGYAIRANPVDFPIMYEPVEGVNYVRWGSKKMGAVDSWNPIASMVSGYRDSFESTIIANLEYEQKLNFLTEGLKFTAQAAFKNWSQSNAFRGAAQNMYQLNSFERQADGSYTYDAVLMGTERTVVLNTTSSTTGDRTLTLKGMLDYNRTFNDVHAVNLLAVYQQEEYNRNNYSYGVGNDAFFSFNSLVNSLPKRRQTLAARATYSYDNRYLFEVNVGYNGSENFAKGKRFGVFPSIALGYNIAEEAYFKPWKEMVQQLKLRGSWGLVGNDQIGQTRFIYLPQITLQAQGYTTGIDMNETHSGPQYNRYANYDLTWEVGEKLNVGIDLRLFNSLSVVFDVFREHRRNIFQQRGTIPNYLGTGNTTVYGNIAEVMNKGFDFSLDYNQRISNDLIVIFKGAFTFAKNEILKYDEPANQQYPNLMNVGRPTDTNFGYIAEGLFIDRAEIANRPEQKISGGVAPGDIKYKNIADKDGNYDNQIDPNDRVALGYPRVPQIVYGFGPSINYKNWDFGFYFQGVARSSLMMSGFHPFGTNENSNVADWIVNSHWSLENQDVHAAYPRLTQAPHGNNTTASSFWLRDASFLKLKNVEIGYRFKGFRIYLSGSNVLTFAKFKHWDPEMGGGNGLKYPTQRVINLGINVNINR